MAGVRHSGLSNVTASDTTVSDDLAVTDAFSSGGRTMLGNAIGDSVGLYGVGPVSQRRSASQAAITTLTGAKTTTNVAAKLNLLVKYDMRVRSDLIALGAIKGAS
jgi:hypothetical protein